MNKLITSVIKITIEENVVAKKTNNNNNKSIRVAVKRSALVFGFKTKISQLYKKKAPQQLAESTKF